MWLAATCCLAQRPTGRFFLAEYPLLILFSPQRKEHCGGIEPHLHKPHFPDMLLTMPLPVMGSVSWSNGQVINLAPGETYFRLNRLCSVLAACCVAATTP
jgi:hypothetical protein